MQSVTHTPRVNVAKELSEISKDFTHPRELVREVIANSLDASASEIRIDVLIDDSSGEEELVIRAIDNGVGMDYEHLCSFFDLGFSDKRGKTDSIGEKGHGTKIAYNSSRIRVATKSLDDSAHIWVATMKEPLRALNKALAKGLEPPQVDLHQISPDSEALLRTYDSGTVVEITGYDRNNKNAFAHGPLKDYVQWFTAWGRVDALAGVTRMPPCKLFLRGLGEPEPEEIPFGHPFPAQDYDFRSLRRKDARRPENHFVRHFVSGDLIVKGHPTRRIQIYFSVEGDSAKRDHNVMLKRRGRKANFPYDQYRYGVQERYGIYLCKDSIPIERKNEQFSATSAWTKWHAFVNCQGFHLTANRSSVDNTPSDLLSAVYDTARDYLENEILASDEYEKFAELQRLEEGRRKSENERRELKKRRSIVQRKQRLTVSADGREFTFLEPRNEQEVTWLLAQLWTLWPAKFPWQRILDHDARFGYDMLVERQSPSTGDQESIFVELKHVLRDSGDFNHSFATLWMIVCWENKLSFEDSALVDIEGKRREFKVSNKTPDRPYTRLHLACPEGGHPIEVLALSTYLLEILGMKTSTGEAVAG